MSSYWWECELCGNRFEFPTVSQSKGIVHYIRDILLPSAWEQSHLVIRCQKCNKMSLRITYDFPRDVKETLRVVHVVGFGTPSDQFIPMMWETYPISTPKDRWFDFKYIRGRSIFGLNKPAVLSKYELKEIFKIYQIKTGMQMFPFDEGVE